MKTTITTIVFSSLIIICVSCRTNKKVFTPPITDDSKGCRYMQISNEYLGSGERKCIQIIDALLKLGEINIRSELFTKKMQSTNNHFWVKNEKKVIHNYNYNIGSSLKVELLQTLDIYKSKSNIIENENKINENKIVKILFSYMDFNYVLINEYRENLHNDTIHYQNSYDYMLESGERNEHFYSYLNINDNIEKNEMNEHEILSLEKNLIDYLTKLGFEINFYTAENNSQTGVAKLKINKMQRDSIQALF